MSTLSSNVEIEVIAHCLRDNSVINLLGEELFLSKETQMLFLACKKMYERGEILDVDNFIHFLKGKEQFDKYVPLLKQPPTRAIDSLLAILYREYNRGLIRELALRDDDDIAFRLQQVLEKLRGHHSFSLTRSYDEMMRYLQNNSDSLFKIGIKGIDEAISFEPDRFITIGGASGSGKTAFTTFLIHRLCELYKDKVDVLFISLEMSEIRVLLRFVSLILGKPIHDIKKGFHKHTNDLLDIRSKLSDCPLQIVYANMDIPKLAMFLQEHINKAKRVGKIPICFIDHIGEVTGLDENTAKSNVDKITSLCKSYARQKGVIFALTQLRKDLLDKRNKDTFFKPDNSYIMNSQSVEARSDIILHLWRPEHHGVQEIVTEEGDAIKIIDTKGSICLVNDKNRDDSKGDIWLNCDIATNRFSDIDKSKIKIYSR